MKRVFILIMAFAILFSFVSCGNKEEPTPAGAWTSNVTNISEDVNVLLAKAISNSVGTSYQPVAYLGSQVVAGTNHALLCTITPVVPNPPKTYAIVVLYQDLQGNVEISAVYNSQAEAIEEISGIVGGWTAQESFAVTEDAENALETALKDQKPLTPVALLGTQIVAGANYSLLCKTSATTSDLESNYVLVHVYKSLDGTAEITDEYHFAKS